MSKLEDSLFAEFALFGLPPPIRQHRFHPSRRWKFDFAWPDRMIAVEVQGGTFIGGVHSRGAGQERDFEKANAATLLGWRVFFFGAPSCRSRQRSRQSSAALEFMYEILTERSDARTDS
jgi:hypothetical protein